MTCRLAFAAMAFFAAATPAHAQFAGDIFFETPSQGVSEIGDEVTFTVQSFSGAQPLGGVNAAVIYDPNALELVELDTTDGADGSSSGQRLAVTSVLQQSGESAFVALNQGSLARPVGTTDLADVTFRVISDGFGQTSIQLVNREIVSTGLSQIGFGGAFGGEVVFGSSSSGGGLGPVAPRPLSSSRKASAGTQLSQSSGSTTSDETQDRLARASKLRRAGIPVAIVVRDEEGSLSTVTVRNVDPDMPVRE